MSNYLAILLALVLSSCLTVSAEGTGPRKKTYYDLYNDFISLPQPKTMFSDVVCKDGDTTRYLLVDVSNGTPAQALFDCGAYTAGKGQLVHVVPGDKKKASFYVELIPSDDVWMGTVYSDDAKRLKKRYQWNDRGLQGSFRDIRSDVDYTGTYKDNRLVGTSHASTPVGSFSWENDGEGGVTHFSTYFPDNKTVAEEGDCFGGKCPVFYDGVKRYTYQIYCAKIIEHRCTIGIIDDLTNLD